MDFIGKKFAIKTKNGKMKEYKIVDLQQFSEQCIIFFAEPISGSKKELYSISNQMLLHGLENNKIKVII